MSGGFFASVASWPVARIALRTSDALEVTDVPRSIAELLRAHGVDVPCYEGPG